ncbi:MAG: pilus assembly protein TadG-related protein [Gammaproteobacteria bacterium]
MPSPSLRRQHGAILVMTALFIVVLIGVAALAMDVGRLVILRSQMQNAADAAALAAAAELDGKDGARERAVAAARDALQHDNSFARVRDLLGPGGLPDDAFTFYCVIGAQYDHNPDDVTDFGIYCNGSDDGSGRYAAVTDPESHYVRVDLDPAKAPGRFSLDLFFLPVLRLLNTETATEAATRAQAVAGRHSIQCNYPPMVICDPFEGQGKSFKRDMPIGTSIVLRDQGGNSSWAPGQFGFLTPISGATGANAGSEALASPEDQGCDTNRVTTEPGQNMQKMIQAINTRFDEYGHAGGFNASEAPPAPNIHEYMDVDSRVAIPGLDASRFSQPDWKYNDWKTAQEARFGPIVNPPWGMGKPLRHDVYRWEIANNRILTKPIPAHAPGSPERRVFAVAVMSCQALSMKGRMSALVNEPDGFAKIFIHSKATPPSNSQILGEYIGWSGLGDANYHVNIQLYE